MTDTVSSTPAERRREKIRASILKAAEQVFAKEGEDGLSIRRLANEIDYSPAAIYKYFGSKDELIDELKEAFFEQIIEAADALEDYPGGFSECARHCLGVYIRTAIEKPHHYAAAFSGISDAQPRDLETFVRSNKGRAFMILSDMVAEGQKQGVLRTDIHEVTAAKSLWASCHGLASLMVHLPHFPMTHPGAPDLPRDEFISFHADQMMRGLELSSAHTKTKSISSRKRTK